MTPELLKAMVPGASWDRCLALAAPLAETFARFGIEGDDQIAVFVAQAAHETASFRYLRETADGTAYEGRKDLGNTQPGDGPRFRGAGIFQTTGRANFRRVGEALRIDTIGHPELLEEPMYAALSAGLYWRDNGLSALCDGTAAGNDRAGAAINTGSPDKVDKMNHRAERKAAWDRAVLVLKSPQTYTALIAAQAALLRMGHYTGAVDGIGGPKTTAAVRAFQEAAGLPPTGSLDADTLAALALPAGYKTTPAGNVTRDDVKDSRIVKEGEKGKVGTVVVAGGAAAAPVATALLSADWKVALIFSVLLIVGGAFVYLCFGNVVRSRVEMWAKGIA